MKRTTDALRPMDSDIRGQMSVCSHHPSLKTSTNGIVKMHYLRKTMDAGIGSPRADCSDRAHQKSRPVLLPVPPAPWGHSDGAELANRGSARRGIQFSPQHDYPGQGGHQRISMSHGASRRSNSSRASACCVRSPSLMTSIRTGLAPSSSPISM